MVLVRVLSSCGFVAILGLCLLGAGPSAVAQESRITAHDIAKSETYDEAQGFSRLQTDLIYIDQLEGEIPMDGAPRYQPPEEPDLAIDDGREVEVTNQVLLGLILAVALWLLWKFGRPMLERFGLIAPGIKRKAENGGQVVTVEVPKADPDLIARLKAMEDREEALVALVQAVLPVAAASNGLRLTRSETARELLRRLPGAWPHMADLRRIVMTEELVQFGGRPLEEQSFLDCLTRAVPILQDGRA